MKLLDDYSEVITYNFDNFPIRAKKGLLSAYPNMSAINHWHKDFEFTIILEGKMSYSVDGKVFHLTEGQCIFVNSGHMHYGFSVDFTECKFICIVLNPLVFVENQRIKDSYIVPLCTDESHPYFIFDPSIPWQNNFINELISIEKYCYEMKNGFELQVMSSFYNVCNTLFNYVKNDKLHLEESINKNVEILQTMVGFIQQNYKNKITLNDIASSGNVCRSNCCKIFQSILKKSPMNYLTEYRLDKSIYLLRTTSHSITEIALQCGFNSSSYFTEMFNKIMHCTPSDYRKFSNI